MEKYDADAIASQAEGEAEKRRRLSSAALQWFTAESRIGGLYLRSEAIGSIAATEGISVQSAAAAIRGTVGDAVDPVQQVEAGGDKYVGVIDYRTYPDAGAYGYIHFNDAHGRLKRVVCARCVEKHTADTQVAHATEGSGDAEMGADWSKLVRLVERHHAESHTQEAQSIEPGASLLSNTTIAGNKAFHTGNDGPSSGLDADTLQGSGPSDLGSDTFTDVQTQFDLPFDLSKRQFYYIIGQNDVVFQSNSALDVWQSVLTGNTVATPPQAVVDSFEDGDLSEYGGDKQAYSIVTSPTTDGSNALRLDNATGGGADSYDGMASTSGLGTYPQRGDKIRCDFIPQADALDNVITLAFGTQGTTKSDDAYYICLDGNNNDFGLGYGPFTGTPDFDIKNLSISNIVEGEKHVFEAEWGTSNSNSEIIGRLYGPDGDVINTSSTSDSTVDTGGIGFGVNQKSGDPKAVYDNYRIV